MEHREITLQTDQNYGKKAPPAEVGALLRNIGDSVRKSILMAVEGRSSSRGRPQSWLINASDIRFVDITGTKDTILHFEIPTMGEAFPELYEQKVLWQTKPSESDTGLDLFSRVLHDVLIKDTNSNLFDRQLIHNISKYNKILNGNYHGILLGNGVTGNKSFISFETIENAKYLGQHTPKPRMGRITGQLDMIRWSTQSFEIILNDREKVNGILIDNDIDELKEYGSGKITIEGKIIYRPSGRILRIDAHSFMPATEQSEIWSKVPPPIGKELDKRSIRKKQTKKNGVNAYFGIWPGDESEEELLALLED